MLHKEGIYRREKKRTRQQNLS